MQLLYPHPTLPESWLTGQLFPGRLENQFCFEISIRLSEDVADAWGVCEGCSFLVNQA